MAATRATSKALRQPLGFVMTMAGFDTTPAEEMPAEPEPRRPADPVSATPQQFDEITTLLRSLDDADPAIDWRARALEYAGVSAQALTKTGAKMLIGKLRTELADLQPQDEASA